MTSPRSILAGVALAAALVVALRPAVALAQVAMPTGPVVERPFTAPHRIPKARTTRHAPPAPAAMTEDQARAARLAESRRRFFDDQARQRDAPDKPGPTEFGGYDAATMSGNLSPGFKF